ncbi:MAG: OmpA family protein [Salaquimonas sp.]
MLNRRNFILSVSAATAAKALPVAAFAQSAAPSAAQIEKSLSVQPTRKIRREDRVMRKDFGRDLRRRSDVRDRVRIAAPSIDIQAINFEFGSARIPRSEQWKVEEIAIAMRRILRRNRGEVFLIEGHTDAVGSNYNNQLLSEDRAASLKRVLVRRFNVDSYALETVGYGEEYLLIQTPREEWRNRRVTLRRVTDFVVR